MRHAKVLHIVSIQCSGTGLIALYQNQYRDAVYLWFLAGLALLCAGVLNHLNGGRR